MTDIINRIPTETLAQIFQVFQLNKDQKHTDGFLDSTQILFRLSLVCRRWREIIQGCPTLWSAICLDVGSTGKVEQQATYQLERAGDTLLSLAIAFPYYYNEERWTGEGPAQALPVRLANILRDTMFRWKSFRMHAHPTEIQLFLDKCIGPTPYLSEIVIKLRDIEFGGVPRTLFIPFQRPGGVESGPPVTARFRSILPMYSSLGTSVTELRVDIGSVGPGLRTVDLITMLLSCPNLVDFLVSGDPKLMTGDIPDPVPVPLLHLTDLHVINIRDPEHFLGALRLKVLQSLYISGHHWDPAMQDVLQRISQTCISLTNLFISSATHVEPRDAPSIPTWEWPAFPSVTHFELQADDLLNPTLQRSALSLPQAQACTLNWVPLDVAYHFLSSSTQLRSLSLYWVKADAVPQGAPIITLPDLLSIKAEESLQLFSHITAPSLSELVIEFSRNIFTLPMVVIRGLIARSNPPLRKLRLSWKGASLTDEDIIWCLQRLPLLEELEIAGTEMSDATLRALEAPPPSEQGVAPDILLPRLRSGTIGQRQMCNEHVTAQGFTALVTSRPTVNWSLDFGTDKPWYLR
ncbi:hypothetical protein BOTBODRAFT_64537 [Botryobasidium botryosum FD-172 SS1]|uniref:F-box domain-containing protein n=1 Tax=Botryobasidium botryosum (strain FD-172 SS1) TaxID=930990 RepID=A0A067MZX4_BOTB1|nr:hypothetical protein BOTBODRAFT_64537 [Botryobasidium botryosum FD-172 SS1]